MTWRSGEGKREKWTFSIEKEETMQEAHGTFPREFKLAGDLNSEAVDYLVAAVQQWIRDQQIIPLLDGLDEMDEAARPLCI